MIVLIVKVQQFLMLLQEGLVRVYNDGNGEVNYNQQELKVGKLQKMD